MTKKQMSDEKLTKALKAIRQHSTKIARRVATQDYAERIAKKTGEDKGEVLKRLKRKADDLEMDNT